MSEKNKFDRYKIIFKGVLVNKSPLIIGCGGGDQTDSDVLKDKTGKPFIPGTSIAGILRHHFYKNYSGFRDTSEVKQESDLLKKYFGYSKGKTSSSSKIIFSDLRSKSKTEIAIRDGIRIDNKIGIVEDGGKFDFEAIEPGVEFEFKIEISGNNKLEMLQLISTIKRDIEAGRIVIGSKTNLGFGKMEFKESSISFYDLEDKFDILKWIKKEDNLFEDDLPKPYEYKTDTSRIEFDFFIKDSLIVRHYSGNPSDSDSVHIKSGGKNIIPGTSIKGAIRARAKKILNTLDINNKDQLFNFLFGNSSKDDKNNGNNYSGSIPSRVKINEVIVKQDVDAGLQQRIKIDRFTGGTIDGALFDSMPIFVKNNDILNRLTIEIANSIDAEMGLLLLVLKDLWTGDLPIGGEKNVGRGIVIGKKAVISHKNKNVEIDGNMSFSDEIKNKLQSYVDALNNSDFKEHIKKMRELYYMEALNA